MPEKIINCMGDSHARSKKLITFPMILAARTRRNNRPLTSTSYKSLSKCQAYTADSENNLTERNGDGTVSFVGSSAGQHIE
jgi:hypothetical protein